MSDFLAYWTQYLPWFFQNIFGSAQPHLWFYMLSFVTLVSAFGVVSARNLIHAAMLLALCFIAIAGIFVLLNAEFLAAIQVLVYAGGIVTLIIFTITLSESITGHKSTAHNRQSTMSMGVAILMALLMVFILIYTREGYFVGPDRWSISIDRNAFPPEPNALLIGKSLMTTYTLAFWIASLILTIAMIGSLILASGETRIASVHLQESDKCEEPPAEQGGAK